MVGTETRALVREQKQAVSRQKTLAKDWSGSQFTESETSQEQGTHFCLRELAAEQFEDRPDELELQIPPGKHLGELVIEANNVSKSFGDRVLIDNLTFRLPAGGIVE